jgi:hypothetical protein
MSSQPTFTWAVGSGGGSISSSGLYTAPNNNDTPALGRRRGHSEWSPTGEPAAFQQHSPCTSTCRPIWHRILRS